MSNLEFSVIIPCFNERDSIVNTVESLMGTLTRYDSFEVVVVNDGSTDGSCELLKEIESTMDRLVVIHHDVNRGYGASLKTAIRRARGERIVITDADGTYPIEDIPQLLDLAGSHDMVVGARVGAKVKYPLIRKIPKLFLVKYASWIAGRKIPDMNSGLRVFKREIALQFMHMYPDGFSFTTTITLAHLTNSYTVHFEPIGYEKRVGKSKIQPVRDTLRFVHLIMRMGMYFAPLRVFSPLILILSASFVGSVTYDIVELNNLTDKSLILLMFTLNTSLFALLADMVDKRSPR